MNQNSRNIVIKESPPAFIFSYTFRRADYRRTRFDHAINTIPFSVI